jgi:hypothetical protein
MALFAEDSVKQALTKTVGALRAIPEKPEKARLLAETLAIFKADSVKVDASTTVNVGWVGQSILGILEKLGSDPPSNSPAIDEVYACIYRFVTELELSSPGELSFELRRFQGFARDNRAFFNPEAQRQMEFADKWMPIAILKELLGSEVIRNVRSTEAYATAVEGKFSAWESTLKAREERATGLHDALKKYENAFNFVGLFEGFKQMANQKEAELLKLRWIVIGLGVLTVAPVIAEVVALYVNRATFEAVRWAFGASVIPALSLTLLLVYFFRLAVRSADGAKSQLLQLELRKTLCQFIQSYVDYAKTMKEERESLAKFESVIFSAIVATDE